MRKRNIILGSALGLIGLFMLIKPAACINAVVVLIGLTAVLIGVYNLFFIYRNTSSKEIQRIVLIKAIVSIAIGLIAVIAPFALVKTFTSIWKILSYILAVYLILFATADIYSIIKSKDISSDDKKKIITESIICILIAILLFIIPIETVGKTFVRTLGLIGLVIGVILIFVEIGISKRTTVITADKVTVKDDVSDEDVSKEEEASQPEESESKSE